jgi:hypothetical protein
MFFLITFTSITVASANTTPVTCPSGLSAKYGCTKVTYSPSGSSVYITDRLFSGSTGSGGALQWHINWAKDWEYSGGWIFREKWGPGEWRTDATYSPWFGFNNDDRTRISNSSVQFQFEYESYSEPPPRYYKWCSWRFEHYLWNNTSAVIENVPCTG